jgi:hypothetical protein
VYSSARGLETARHGVIGGASGDDLSRRALEGFALEEYDSGHITKASRVVCSGWKRATSLTVS